MQVGRWSKKRLFLFPIFALMSMKIYPLSLQESLDFGFIRNHISSFCATEYAREKIRVVGPETDEEVVMTELRCCDEILAHLLAAERFPSTHFESIISAARVLKTPGTTLEEKRLADIRSLLVNYAHIYLFLKQRKERFSHLFEQIAEAEPLDHLVEAIDHILDERGIVRSNASRQLADIRQELVKSRARAARVFERMVKKYRDRGLLAEFDETVSENRRVLAIQSTYKGQVQGILHGSSSKNSIVYIEPAETVEVNNEVAQLIDDERQEIRRILKELSQEVRPYASHLVSIEENFTFLDFQKAKALYAKEENCCVPQVARDRRQLHLKEAFNPVLSILNKGKGKSTIPLNLSLQENMRILVISGPNAGGKSIALKTIGLLSLMLQSGIPVPVHPDSSMSIFSQMFGDIGDSQSIENELSTYSSKLEKMRHFLNHADDSTLLLIDEFGSGSDPQLGSALAQVFLEKLNSYKAFGIFTTHYNAIKALAAKLPGVENAAMLFNKKDFTPEYLLEVGNPGSSYTFEVAEKSGIPPHMIGEARERVDQNMLEMDRLLVQLQEDKLQLEKKQQNLNKDLQRLRELERQREQTIARLEDKLSKQSRQNEENDRLIYWGQRFQKLVSSWMDQGGKKDKKEVVARFIALLNQRSGEVETEEKKNYSKAQSKRDKKLNELKGQEAKVGDKVKLLSNGFSGIVTEIKKDRYTITLGNNITTTVEREQFIPADADVGNKPQRKKRKKQFSHKGKNNQASGPQKNPGQSEGKDSKS